MKLADNIRYMGFTVAGVEFQDPHQCLREVLQMVRTGVCCGKAGVEVRELIANALRRLKDERGKHPGIFDEVEQLRLLTLEAESYQENGEFDKAARILEPVWRNLKPRLDAWSKKELLEPTGDAALCRQKIWALLDYVFFAYCRLSGNQKLALKYFLRLEEVIRGELQTKKRIPHGTLALCHYYIAICFNVVGPDLAEHHLLEAQKNTYARASRQLARETIDRVEKEYEIAYKNVFGARVLSGLARVDMQQGRLTRAEHLLYTAQNLLLGTQKEWLKRFITLMQWTVVRRRTAHAEPAYARALTELADQFTRYLNIRDPTGQLRCGLELARGYLDWAEFSDSDTEKGLRLEEAAYWLRTIPASAPLAADIFRTEILKVRLCLLKGEVKEAEDKATDARRALKDDLLPECGIELSLVEALYCLHTSPPDTRLAERLIQRSLDTIRLQRSQNSEAERRSDPVLEAECYLLLAKTKLLTGNADAAQKHLNEWTILRQFIDNYYLRHLGNVLQAELHAHGPRFERTFEGYDPITGQVTRTIPECLEDYENWLRSVIKSRYGITKKKDLAKFYGRDPSNIDRKKAAR
jgi:hypothetical protein